MINSTLLFLRPLQRSDSGVYRCEVANDINHRSRDVRIVIQGERSIHTRTQLTPIASSSLGSTVHARTSQRVSLPVTLSFNLKCDTVSLLLVLYILTVYQAVTHFSLQFFSISASVSVLCEQEGVLTLIIIDPQIQSHCMPISLDQHWVSRC